MSLPHPASSSLYLVRVDAVALSLSHTYVALSTPLVVLSPISLFNPLLSLCLICSCRPLFLSLQDGQVWTWGIGSQGQLGRMDPFNAGELILIRRVGFGLILVYRAERQILPGVAGAFGPHQCR